MGHALIPPIACSRRVVSGFTPQTVAGLRVYVDAYNGITAPSGVSSWADQSGSGAITGGALTQATVGLRPAYSAAHASWGGRPVVVFNGTTNQCIFGVYGADFPQPATYIVVSRLGTIQNAALVDAQPGEAAKRHAVFFSGATPTADLYAGVTAGTNNASYVGAYWQSPFVLTAVFNGVASSVRVNGNVVWSAGSVGAFVSNSFSLGQLQQGLYNYIGEIASALCYSGDKVASGDAVTVERYLGARWGITVA